MLKTVYFDLGNVLFFFSHSKMLEQIAQCCALPKEEIKRLIIDEHLQDAYEMGKIDSQGLYRFFRSRSRKSFSLHELIEAISDIFVPNEALWPTVEQLKKEGLRLLLISNTCESHYNRIYSHYPILRLFDQKILSFEVGSLKPHPRIFQKALSLSECSHSECFYTDDIPAYVAGARKAGLDAEVYTDVPTLRRHLIDRGCAFLINSTGK
jgi:putative hydrolase of the HAD superfamily